MLNARGIPLEFEDLPYLALGIYVGHLSVKVSDVAWGILLTPKYLRTGKCFISMIRNSNSRAFIIPRLLATGIACLACCQICTFPIMGEARPGCWD